MEGRVWIRGWLEGELGGACWWAGQGREGWGGAGRTRPAQSLRSGCPSTCPGREGTAEKAGGRGREGPGFPPGPLRGADPERVEKGGVRGCAAWWPGLCSRAAGTRPNSATLQWATLGKRLPGLSSLLHGMKKVVASAPPRGVAWGSRELLRGAARTAAVLEPRGWTHSFCTLFPPTPSRPPGTCSPWEDRPLSG